MSNLKVNNRIKDKCIRFEVGGLRSGRGRDVGEILT
ncbi:unnamed protein product, partial [marine sediment metagenome]